MQVITCKHTMIETRLNNLDLAKSHNPDHHKSNNTSFKSLKWHSDKHGETYREHYAKYLYKHIGDVLSLEVC